MASYKPKVTTYKPLLKPTRKVTAAEIGEGIKYTAHDWTASGGRKRRKPTLEELERTRDACARSQAASDEIRKAAGLEPIPPNFFREQLEAAIANAKPTRRRKRARRKPAKPLNIPAVLRTELDALGSEYGFKLVAA